MRAWLLLIVCLFISQLFFAQTAVEKDWMVTIKERLIEDDGYLAFLSAPRVVVDKFGNIYNTGFSGGGPKFELLLGEEEILAEGDWSQYNFLSQLDADGNAQWIKRFSSIISGYYFHYDLPRAVPHPDGGVILVALVKNTLKYGDDLLMQTPYWPSLFIASVDVSGELRSYRVISTTLLNITDVIGTKNGDIIITGRLEESSGRLGSKSIENDGDPSYYVARLGLDGTVKWLKNIQSAFSLSDVGHAQVLELSDNNFAVCFSPWQYNHFRFGCPEEFNDLSLVKLDGLTGEVLWQKEIARLKFTHITGLVERENGDLYVAGIVGGGSRVYLPNGQRIIINYDFNDCKLRKTLLIKLTSSGFVYDAYLSEDNFYPHKMVNLDNGYYLLAGRFLEAERDEDENLIIFPSLGLKLYDAKDNLIYRSNVTRTREYDLSILDLSLVDQNTVVISGAFDKYFLGEQIDRTDYNEEWRFVSKLTINTAQNRVEEEQNIEVEFFPNPTSGLLYLRSENAFFGDRPLRIYDSIGRQVKTLPTLGDRTQFYIDISELPTGIYFLQIGEGNTNVHKIYKR